jgi:hypothetical protein
MHELASVGDNYGPVSVYNWEGSKEDLERRKGGSFSTVLTT